MITFLAAMRSYFHGLCFAFMGIHTVLISAQCYPYGIYINTQARGYSVYFSLHLIVECPHFQNLNQK